MHYYVIVHTTYAYTYVYVSHNGAELFLKSHSNFYQSQNESAVLNVFQDLKSKISEKLDQN